MARTTAQVLMVGVMVAAGHNCLLAETLAPKACAGRETMPYQLRILDCRTAAIVTDGMARSPTFQRLVDRVGQLKGIVYIKHGYYVNEQTGHRRVFSGGLSHKISMAGAYRVLHLMVAQESGDRRLSITAHELQHVIEVLEATDVTNEAAVDRLFERIGIQASAGVTETEAALAIELVVARELSANRESVPVRAQKSVLASNPHPGAEAERGGKAPVVRPASPTLAGAVQDGRRRSSTFDALIIRLENSDLIVYLRVGSCPDPQSLACLSMIGAAPSNRFVQLTFVMRMHGVDTILARFTDHFIAQIGHELQHALEVADDPTVVDGLTLDSAYRRLGFRPDPKTTTYETSNAISAGRSVLNELHTR
jgi:hypothetical protein